LTTFRDFSTHHDVSRLGPNGRNVRSAYSRDGKWLATASEDRLLRLFDIRTGAPTCSFRGDLHDLFCLGFSPDSRLLAAGGGGLTRGVSTHVTVGDVGTHRQVAKREGHALAVIGVAFAPRGGLIATASADRTVRVWDGKSFKLRLSLVGHNAPV